MCLQNHFRGVQEKDERCCEKPRLCTARKLLPPGTFSLPWLMERWAPSLQSLLEQYKELSLGKYKEFFFKPQLFKFFLHTISPVLLILCVAVFKKQLLTIYGLKLSNTSPGRSVVTQTANWPGYRMSSLLDLRGVNPVYPTFVPH